MIFEGQGGQIELGAAGLTIRRKGALATMIHGRKGEKFIPYSSITAVQFKKARFSAGYIQFSIGGGSESTGGVYDALSDENSLTFLAEGNEEFARLREIVQERMVASRAPADRPVSPVELILQLGGLRDAGLLTDTEFERKKAELLAQVGPGATAAADASPFGPAAPAAASPWAPIEPATEPAEPPATEPSWDAAQPREGDRKAAWWIIGGAAAIAALLAVASPSPPPPQPDPQPTTSVAAAEAPLKGLVLSARAAERVDGGEQPLLRLWCDPAAGPGLSFDLVRPAASPPPLRGVFASIKVDDQPPVRAEMGWFGGGNWGPRSWRDSGGMPFAAQQRLALAIAHGRRISLDGFAGHAPAITEWSIELASPERERLATACRGPAPRRRLAEAARAGRGQQRPATAGTPVSTAAAATPAPAPRPAEPEVTMANYDRLRTGMTYRQVTAIVGPPDEEMARSEVAGYETVMYSWRQGMFGANMNVMFQNGRLVQKAQFGLR